MTPFGHYKKNQEYTVHGYSADEILHLIRTKKDAFWSRMREEKPLELFHEAARRVPAYKDFLKKNKINPAKIKTFQDFQLVPPVSKQNYLRQYPLEKLVWDGSLAQPLVFTATSGSTGEPFYFPRNHLLDWQSALYHEMFLNNDSQGEKQSTLVIVGFGMGVWIGGLITYKAFEQVAYRTHPATLLTTGTNKKEIFEALKKIGPKYDRVILCGYPPFIKDVIDEAEDHEVDWHKFNMKIVFAAESFSEKFRDYIMRKTGMKNPFIDTMNIYGSADLGTMAEETPLTILLRRIAVNKPETHQALFPQTNRLPTLVQFNPLFINFEVVNGEIFCTGDNTLPLIRYRIGDNGGVLNFSEAKNILRKVDISLPQEAKKKKIQRTISELPMVYIYERSDFSTKLYGAIIYPEHVKEGLSTRSIEKYITGKFSMITKTDKSHNEYLELNVELKPRVKGNVRIKNAVHSLVKEGLQRLNAEYKYLSDMMPGRVDPHIVLWRYEHPLHFKPGIKQKWVKKDLKLNK